MLEVCDVTTAYGKAQALWEVCLEVQEAEIVAHSAQYVDDATSSDPIRFNNKFLYAPISSAHKMFLNPLMRRWLIILIMLPLFLRLHIYMQNN